MDNTSLKMRSKQMFSIIEWTASYIRHALIPRSVMVTRDTDIMSRL